MKTKYIRLLSYNNACKVIDFINDNKHGYSYVTVGGIAIQEYNGNWEKIEDFIVSLSVSYEITDIPPHQINREIIRELKDKSVI